MQWVMRIGGVIAVLLGGLWLVQGLGLVTIPPILCVADCETLTGPSTVWTIAGLVLLLVGAAAIVLAGRQGR
jgi:hypothetical protein